MRAVIWWCLSLTGMVVLWPVLARADDGSSGKSADEKNQSHILIPLHGMDLRQALADRFLALKESSEAKKSLQEFLKNPELLKDQEKFDQLVDWYKKGRLSPNDPFLRDLQESMRRHKADLSPEQQEQVQRFINEFKARNAGFGRQNVEGNSSATEGDRASSPSEEGRPEVGPGAFPPPNNHGPPPEAPEAEPNLQDKITRWLAENLEGQDSAWADSPALHEMLRELKRPHLEMGDWSGLDQTTWSGQFAGWSRSLLQNQFWSELDWSRLSKLPGLKSPGRGIDLPKLETSWKPHAPATMPNLPLPTAAAMNRGVELLWGVLIIVLGVVVWKIFRARSAEQVGGQGRAWKLGPWPVAPGAVASREELILAFEYLSFLKLGPAARNRNHLVLADGLAGNNEEQRRAAKSLASLYELARYAPDLDALSNDALTTARRELCYLAETAG